jgi:hypothetical protein
MGLGDRYSGIPCVIPTPTGDLDHPISDTIRAVDCAVNTVMLRRSHRHSAWPSS